MTAPWAAGAGRALAEELFAALRRAGDDGVGITRDSYGAGESAALDIVEAAARARGLDTARDAGANLVVTLAGSDPSLPVLACGSHLDSVPQGGNYDGAAGVIAGLLALARMRAEGVVPRRGIRLYGLRGEESAAFGRAYMGSSALFGLLRAGDPIPAYRLSAGSKLPGSPTLAARWKPVLEPELARLADDHLVVDLRSGSYAALGRLPGAVQVDVLAERPDGTRSVISHFNKAHKGRLARALATSRAEPHDAAGVAAVARRAGMRVERTGNDVTVVIDA